MIQETEHNGVVAVEAAETKQVSFYPTHKHNGRGTLYQVIAAAKMQAEWFDRRGDGVDMNDVVVYQGEDGQIWVRPHSEFHDGRFKPLERLFSNEESQPMTDHKDARQLLATQPASKATWKEAVTFLENASRNWRTFPKLSQADLEDVATALDQYCAKQNQRIAELEADRQWRLIKTAPVSNGSQPFSASQQFLAFVPGDGCVVAASYSKGLAFDYRGHRLRGATHWMPLPASPHEGTQS